jgi:glycosyltransferase involved in cell wall biosynthesis
MNRELKLLFEYTRSCSLRRRARNACTRAAPGLSLHRGALRPYWRPSADRASGVTVESATFLREHARSIGALIDQNRLRSPAIRKLAVLGNHMPRQCGIATFTSDLTDALQREYDELDCFVLAMNDKGNHHAYPDRVRFSLAEADLGAYQRAADFLNASGADALSLQHEFGIFGGRAGSHVLALLRELRIPTVTTLHTVLSRPDLAQRAVLDEILQRSERVVVMSEHGARILREVYRARDARIDVIPHGIPVFPQVAASKAKLGLDKKTVIMTFGLLSPDKGIEHVIDALPAIIALHPDVVYLVLGATHPHVKEQHGETYRLLLEERAKKLGVASNIVFHNRFVGHDELVQFLSAADVYITPYLNEEQITSGTLAYAVGAGKATLSTPYHYARELLADGRGVIVPFRDGRATAEAVCALLGDETARLAMQAKAASYGKAMTWPVVARSYAASFERAMTDYKSRTPSSYSPTLTMRPADLPELNLVHLRAMTDDTGLLQHATFDVPSYDDGYCVDDNARGLRAMVLAEESGAEPLSEIRSLAARYLAFVSHAFDRSSGRFRNFLSYQRGWTERVGSEDSHGRSLWALGSLVGRSTDGPRRRAARGLFLNGLPATPAFESPRAWAYTLLGIDEYALAFGQEAEVESVRAALAQALYARFEASQSATWPWFEHSLTYCNARLSQALLTSGARLGRSDMVDAALRSLEWLLSVQRSNDGCFAPIGSNGFYVKDGHKAEFDQQPVEAGAMLSACLTARRVTGQRFWSEQARWLFYWFVGQNHRRESLYDPATGGCRDGLHAESVNENQGAESTLSFTMALLELRLAEREVALRAESEERRASSQSAMAAVSA